MVWLAPRALQEIGRPRRSAGASARPLNFTVRRRCSVLLYISIAVLAWLGWYLARHGQRRVAVAFVLAPLLVSLLFGWPGMLLVLPFALAITALVATPLFFFVRRRGWLKWWQVGLAGLLCGVIFTLLVDAASPGRLDAFGLEDALLFGGVGTLIAIVFWWLAVYRNSTFPGVPRSVPYGMLVLIPITVLGVLLHRSFYITFADGRIVAVTGEAPSRQVTVRLSNGAVVETSLLRDSRPTGVLMNQCWHLMNHWSATRFKRVYSLEAPFGGGVNDC